MHKAKKRSLSCCYCCIEALSGFLLLMLVASTITLLRYFLEFYEPMPAYSGNKTHLLINMTTIPKPVSQSFAAAEMLPHSSASAVKVSQRLAAPLTSSSPPSLISSANSTLLQQTSPTNHLQQQTSDRRKIESPQVPTEKTISSAFPPPLISATEPTLLHRLTSSTKQRSPKQLLTLSVKRESPQQIKVATGMTSPQQLMSTVSLTSSQKLTSAWEPTLVQQQTIAVELRSSRDVKTDSPWQRTLPLNVTHAQKPFSDQTGENETIQYFKGSFSLVNESYQSTYSDSTSEDFRNEALKLENMMLRVSQMIETQISNAFAKSSLKQHYQDSSIMALEPSPFRAHFIVRMSNGAQASQLSPDTMAQEMIEGYQKSPGHEVLLDEESLQVEVYNGLCLLKPSSPQLPNWASDSNRKGDKKGFPWHVTVLKDGDPACTGSLVTEKWVLSTSNCVASGNDSSVYSVQLGAMDKHADGSERYPIAKIIRSSSTVQDNLVLIQLARPPPITPLVHPICLPDWTQVAPVGTKCNSLGSKKNDKPNVMEWTVTSSLGCNLPSSPTSLCAQTEDLKKDTQMTAGGSFVCPGENEQLYLEGIIPSTIKSKEKSQLKQQLVVFTRVAPRVQWIESQVRP